MVPLPSIHSPPLCATFQKESAQIWTDIGNANALGLIYDEETITNVMLQRVQMAHPYEVMTFQFTKPEEKNTGADWEWWLTDGRLWFGLLIQAKRLNAKSHKYSIKKLVGKAKKPQIDILIEQAHLKGIDPLYFFYNYTKRGSSAFEWNCKSTPLDLLQLGCTVAHAGAVKSILTHGGAGLPKISPISYPLRCLVCCPVLADPEPSLPGCAHGIAKQLRRFVDRGVALTEGDSGPRENPPPYVYRLLDTSPENRGTVIEELRQEVGPIGSLVIIKDRRERSV